MSNSHSSHSTSCSLARQGQQTCWWISLGSAGRLLTQSPFASLGDIIAWFGCRRRRWLSSVEEERVNSISLSFINDYATKLLYFLNWTQAEITWKFMNFVNFFTSSDRTFTVFSYISTRFGCSFDLGWGMAREQHRQVYSITAWFSPSSSNLFWK